MSVPPDARVEITRQQRDGQGDGLRGHVKAMVDQRSRRAERTPRLGRCGAGQRLRVGEDGGGDRRASGWRGTNGGSALEVPKDTKATLTARSVNGGLTVTGLTAQEATGRRIRNLESVLNGGGPEIDVRVTNGRISITEFVTAK